MSLSCQNANPVSKDGPTSRSQDLEAAPCDVPLNRVFTIDIQPCPKCGGKLRVIACSVDPDVIAIILEHIRT